MLVFLCSHTRARVHTHHPSISLHMDQNITGHHRAFGFSQVFITNGWLSDLVIVVAVTNREARSPAHGISLFLVENGMKGFIKGRKLHKMGMKAQVSHGMHQILAVRRVYSPSENREAELPTASSSVDCQGVFSEMATRGVLNICFRNGKGSFCNCNEPSVEL